MKFDIEKFYQVQIMKANRNQFVTSTHYAHLHRSTCEIYKRALRSE